MIHVCNLCRLCSIGINYLIDSTQITDHYICLLLQRGLCRTVDADDVVIDERPCPNDCECTVGPKPVEVNGKDVQGYFCDGPRRPDVSRQTLIIYVL